MTTQEKVRKLASLDDWQLENSHQDVRGKTLVDLQGRSIARIDDMLADLDKEKIVALRLKDDRIVNVDNVDIRDGQPVLTVDPGHVPSPAQDFDRNNVTSEHIPIIEETLAVGKRQVELGKVRIRSRVVSEDVREDVTLRKEQVHVERRELDTPISAAQADTMLSDDTIEMTETDEQVVVEKRAMLTGEVVVGKDVNTRTEHVEGTVRHTEVDVDRDPARRR